jgi:hypothetical protein
MEVASNALNALLPIFAWIEEIIGIPTNIPQSN